MVCYNEQAMKKIKQEDIISKMTGEKRLDQAFALSDFLRDLTVTNIKHLLGKKASREKILKELKKRVMQTQLG